MEEPQRLIELLEILRQYGVLHYRDDEIEISLAAAEASPAAPKPREDGTTVPMKRQAYESLFKGRPPSFQDFKDRGLPITEGSV